MPADSSVIEIQRVRASEQVPLWELLARSTDENAYLLGLLSDFSLAELQNMPWGDFFWGRTEAGREGVFYLDVTGLLVVSGAPVPTLNAFAEYAVNQKLFINRIISSRSQVLPLESALREIGPWWARSVRRFEEQAMVLRPENIAPLEEPDLHLAHARQATAIAEGSAQAMEEELGIHCTGRDFDRLVRSKMDLIERGRYHIVERGRQIVFQAYLSASLPEVAQVQGVWVPPEHRNLGIATRSLAEMCRRNLASSNHIVLRVQSQNLPALAVYSRIGFQTFLDCLSVWFRQHTP